MKTINLRMLRRYGACQEQREHFEAKFGLENVEVTVEKCVALRYEFDFSWCIDRIFCWEHRSHVREMQREALREVEKAERLASDAYNMFNGSNKDRRELYVTWRQKCDAVVEESRKVEAQLFAETWQRLEEKDLAKAEYTEQQIDDDEDLAEDEEDEDDYSDADEEYEDVEPDQAGTAPAPAED